MWKNNRVKFTTPPTTRTRNSSGTAAGGNSDEEQEDSDSPKKEFFNLFVLHQNRVKRTAKVSQCCACIHRCLICYMLCML
jgi:hypothetical protein